MPNIEGKKGPSFHIDLNTDGHSDVWWGATSSTNVTHDRSEEATSLTGALCVAQESDRSLGDGAGSRPVSTLITILDASDAINAVDWD